MTRSFEDSSLEARRAARNPPAPDKAAVYARFIPREELRSFAAWSLRSLDDGTPPEPVNSGVMRPKPPAPPEPAPAPPQQTAEDVAALLKASRQAGYQDGYRDGLVALEAFKTNFMNQMVGQFGSIHDNFQQQLDGLHAQMSQALLRTATQLARQVVRSEIQTRPELIAQVAQEALGVLLNSARHITVRVNPEDVSAVAQGASDVLAARQARLVPDASVARGGCLVDSDLGMVEANIETRWRRAAELVGSREEFDAPPPAAALRDDLGAVAPETPASFEEGR